LPRALKARDWTGIVVRELLGPRDITFAEATHIIGERIGKLDLKYVQFPYADFASSLVQMGISANVAALYAEMARAFNDGEVRSREGRTAEHTTPTRFEDFAEDLARAYERACFTSFKRSSTAATVSSSTIRSSSRNSGAHPARSLRARSSAWTMSRLRLTPSALARRSTDVSRAAGMCTVVGM
jgi:hypothetical protein